MYMYVFLFRHSCFVQDIGILGPGENEVLCLRGALTDLEVLFCSVTKTFIVILLVLASTYTNILYKMCLTLICWRHVFSCTVPTARTTWAGWACAVGWASCTRYGAPPKTGDSPVRTQQLCNSSWVNTNARQMPLLMLFFFFLLRKGKKKARRLKIRRWDVLKTC